MRTCGDGGALRVEGQTHDLRGVAPVCVQQLAALGVPQLAGLVEGARDDLQAQQQQR